MKKRSRLAALILTALILPVFSIGSNQHPNIVVILADDMGWGDVSCQNPNSKYATPNIDALAKSGTRFTDAHTSSSVCTPSRYSLLTGRYCWRTSKKKGVLNGFSGPLMSPDRLTLASMLKAKGYSTACVGKWHLGLGWQDNGTPETKDGSHIDFSSTFANGPTTFGFDTFFGISASNNMPPYCFLKDDRALELPTEAKVPAWDAQNAKSLMSPGWDDSETGIRFTEEAVAFIEQHEKKQTGQPFFLYLPSEAPHRPCVPSERFKGKSGAGFRGDMVLEFDWTVGQIMQTLERLAIRENTLIIVSSDNGGRHGDLTRIFGDDAPVGRAPTEAVGPIIQEQLTYGHLSNANWRGQKADIWEAGHRVVCLFSWPAKIAANQVDNQTICLTDIMATCASIVGHSLKDNQGEDSFTLLPSLLGQAQNKPARAPIIHHSLNGTFSIRRGPWKLIAGQSSGGFTKEDGVDTPGQLYQLDQDPSETRNLWNEHPEVVESLSQELTAIQEGDHTRRM